MSFTSHPALKLTYITECSYTTKVELYWLFLHLFLGCNELWMRRRHDVRIQVYGVLPWRQTQVVWDSQGMLGFQKQIQTCMYLSNQWSQQHINLSFKVINFQDKCAVYRHELCSGLTVTIFMLSCHHDPHRKKLCHLCAYILMSLFIGYVPVWLSQFLFQVAIMIHIEKNVCNFIHIYYCTVFEHRLCSCLTVTIFVAIMMLTVE